MAQTEQMNHTDWLIDEAHRLISEKKQKDKNERVKLIKSIIKTLAYTALACSAILAATIATATKPPPKQNDSNTQPASASPSDNSQSDLPQYLDLFRQELGKVR
jgi:hypothetical protein